MNVIAVFNTKGGVGKTTTCLNLAAGLARSQRLPLAIDLDPQANLTIGLGVGPVNRDDSLFAFYQGEKTLAQLLQPLETGLALIPAHSEMSKIDALHARDARISTRLKEGLASELAEYPGPVLIDCCPMLGVLSLNALMAADQVLMPVSADYLSLQGVNRLEAAIVALEKALKRPVQRRVVLTRFDSRRKFSHAIQEQLNALFGARLCATRIAENVNLAEAPAHGRDIFRHAPSSQGARDYAALLEELDAEKFFG